MRLDVDRFCRWRAGISYDNRTRTAQIGFARVTEDTDIVIGQTFSAKRLPASMEPRPRGIRYSVPSCRRKSDARDLPISDRGTRAWDSRSCLFPYRDNPRDRRRV